MTSYETVMMVLGILTFVITFISLIVKLLLIIVDKSIKNNYLMCLVNCEVVISTFTNPRHNRLSVVPLFSYIIVYAKMNVNIRFVYLSIFVLFI